MLTVWGAYFWRGLFSEFHGMSDDIKRYSCLDKIELITLNWVIIIIIIIIIILIIIIIIIPLITLGSIYSTNASGAEQLPETNNSN